MLQPLLGYKRMVTQTTVTLPLGEKPATLVVWHVHSTGTLLWTVRPLFEFVTPNKENVRPRGSMFITETWSSIWKSYPGLSQALLQPGEEAEIYDSRKAPKAFS